MMNMYDSINKTNIPYCVDIDDKHGMTGSNLQDCEDTALIKNMYDMIVRTLIKNMYDRIR